MEQHLIRYIYFKKLIFKYMYCAIYVNTAAENICVKVIRNLHLAFFE